jgi:cellobiose-specific phosphotransferase system component IIC
VVLLNAPKLRQARWINDLKDASIAALPRNVIAVALLMIVEKLLQEIPQKSSVWREKSKSFPLKNKS